MHIIDSLLRFEKFSIIKHNSLSFELDKRLSSYTYQLCQRTLMNKNSHIVSKISILIFEWKPKQTFGRRGFETDRNGNRNRIRNRSPGSAKFSKMDVLWPVKKLKMQ